MSMYRKEWGCCGSITETDAWEPEDCPFCKPLAQQTEPVEPVAWECKAGGLKPLTQRQYDAQTVATKRHYTRIAPPQRTMVPLTEEEIDAEWRELDGEVSTMFMRVLRKFARAVEKASWEKNNG